MPCWETSGLKSGGGGIEPPSEAEKPETLSDLKSPGVRIPSVDAVGLYP